ncbi:MAG: hypothetical protein C4289_14585 [Chloroflexota bacterium]
MSKQWTSNREPGTASVLAALMLPPARTGTEVQQLLHTLGEHAWRLLRPTAVDVVLLAAAIDRTFLTALLLNPRAALQAFRADPDAVLGNRSRLARLGPLVRQLSDEEIEALAAIKAANLDEFAHQVLVLTGAPGAEHLDRDNGAQVPAPWQPSLQPAMQLRNGHTSTSEAAEAAPRQRARVTRLRFLHASTHGIGRQSDARRNASSRAGPPTRHLTLS